MIQIQFRRGTALEWTTEDPTLAEGEMGIELGTGKYKIGTGADSWTSLPYGGLDGLPIEIGVAASDEITPITTGTDKIIFRAPAAFTLGSVRASLSVAQASGLIFTVGVTVNGASIFSTGLTIDNTEKTSLTATTPAVLSLTDIPDDAEISVSVDQLGDGTAKGLKLWFIGGR